ncbi:lipopolysaccharide biosynthesis protein [Salinarimonas soli]|uniref:lipopolysaccharide biosynthesis protein n=1 Tax=Salinarimonas soli TaxID=1638099 RepID=UPI001F0B4843|nr:polysaccharide biosynthesis C-terminal domain-containing protein [Salinarimonas soli]
MTALVDHVSTARRSAANVLAIRVAGAGLAYATQVLFARLMGKADYGVFATVWVWTAILGHSSLWGMSQAVCRFVPEHQARGEIPLVRGFLAGGLAFALAGGLATAAALGAVLLLWGEAIGAAHAGPLAVALVIIPFFALQDFVEGVARSFGWTTLAIAPLYLLRQGLIAATMVGAVIGGVQADAATALLCTLAAIVMSLGVQGALLLRAVRAVIPRGPRRFDGRLWARRSLPMALVDLTLLGLNFADVLILGLFAPPEAVAVYFAATRLLQFAVFVQYAASAATAQRFACAGARGEQAALRALAISTARLSTLATMGVAGSILVASPWLLSLFGPGFEASVPVLAILLAGVVVQTAFGPAESLLTMLGHERACAGLVAAALLAAVILNLMLAPAFGMVGVAVASALSMAGRGAALAIAAQQRCGFPTHALVRTARS